MLEIDTLSWLVLLLQEFNIFYSLTIHRLSFMFNFVYNSTVFFMMTLIDKVLLIGLLFSITFFWYKYVPRMIIKTIGNLHRAFNKKRIHKQPIKFFLEREELIIKMYQYLSWIGFAMIVIAILYNDIPKPNQ